MSRLTGRSDLYDHIYMIGADANFTRKELFEKFKKRTGGVIYQDIKVELTRHNIEFFLEKDKTKLKKVEDGYEYWGKLYKTLNKLNKHGFYTQRKIYFNDELELFPYLGHIIAMCASDAESEYVVISKYDENIYREIEGLKYGIERQTPDFIKNEYKELLKEILEIEDNPYLSYKRG